MTQRLLTGLVCALGVSIVGQLAWADPPSEGCSTIQGGAIMDSEGMVLEPGFDRWGYNFQAHMFSGLYCDAYRNAAWCQPYAEVALMMTWNDAWLSRDDCDGDMLLDRHWGFPSYIGSGAWLTNHMRGTEEVDGTTCTWEYFVKIVAAPADAVAEGGQWYTADGEPIGEVIWSDFAIVQEVQNDPCAGLTGLQFVSPGQAGLGYARHLRP